MPYRYNNHKIYIPRHAESTAAFNPRSGIFREIVQNVLDSVEPWKKNEDPIETFHLPRRIGARVIALATHEEPLWGINPYHSARTPGLSPYFELGPDDPRKLTDLAALELTGTPDKPILTRIYPGEYMPPLPWMSSARRADGGLAACTEYWNQHAFILRPHRGPEQLTETPPDWYAPAALPAPHDGPAAV